MNKSKSDSQLLNFKNIIFKPLKKKIIICNQYVPFTKNGPCRYCFKTHCQNNIQSNLHTKKK